MQARNTPAPALPFFDEADFGDLELGRPQHDPARRPVPARISYPLEAGWEREDSDVYRLSLPPDVAEGEVFPDIETALLAAADQLHRRPTQPELPPIADKHRRLRD